MALVVLPRCLATVPISSTNALNTSSRLSGEADSLTAHSFAFMGCLHSSSQLGVWSVWADYTLQRRALPGFSRPGQAQPRLSFCWILHASFQAFDPPAADRRPRRAPRPGRQVQTGAAHSNLVRRRGANNEVAWLSGWLNGETPGTPAHAKAAESSTSGDSTRSGERLANPPSPVRIREGPLFLTLSGPDSDKLTPHETPGFPNRSRVNLAERPDVNRRAASVPSGPAWRG
jgi:hypothetical protein